LACRTLPGLFFLLFVHLEGLGLFLYRRECFVESGSDKAGKALMRLAAGFRLKTHAGTG
jgi:hypothetical protein